MAVCTAYGVLKMMKLPTEKDEKPDTDVIWPAREKYLKAVTNQASRGADDRADALLRAVQKIARPPGAIPGGGALIAPGLSFRGAQAVC